MMRRFGAVSAGGGGGGDPVAASIFSKLTSWWEMGEGSGTRNDSKGTNHLTVSGTVTTASGVRGGGDVAAAFAGSGGLYVDSNPTIRVDVGGGAHCMFGWVYLTSNSGSQFFFSKWDNATTWSIGAEYIGSLQGGSYYAQNGGSSYTNAGITAPAAGAWHFYVMWRDPADGKVRLQLDNGAIAVSTGASNPGGNGIALTFARDYASAYRMTGRLQRWGWIKGAILTADERAYLYNSGAGHTFAELAAAGA